MTHRPKLLVVINSAILRVLLFGERKCPLIIFWSSIFYEQSILFQMISLQKAKCGAILRKNPTKRSKPSDVDKDKEQGEKSRRSTRKDKKNNPKQKACFREARKLRSYCGQLSKCCTVNKLQVLNVFVFWIGEGREALLDANFYTSVNPFTHFQKQAVTSQRKCSGAPFHPEPQFEKRESAHLSRRVPQESSVVIEKIPKIGSDFPLSTKRNEGNVPLCLSWILEEAGRG